MQQDTSYYQNLCTCDVLETLGESMLFPCFLEHMQKKWPGKHLIESYTGGLEHPYDIQAET